MTLFLFFGLGLILGSFVNALVYRERTELSLLGRSHCPHCRKTLSWYDNIPLASFLLLRGRCRNCRKKISFQYPLVESLTGIAFLLAGWYYLVDPSARGPETLWLMILTVLMIALGVYDFRYLEVPVSWVAFGVVFSLPYLFLFEADYEVGGFPLPALHLAGALAVAFFFFLLVFFSKEQWMGWGDVWLGFLAGLTVSLPALLFLLTISFSLGALVGVGLIWAGRKKMKSALPFAPFLALGTLATLYLSRLAPEILSFFFL